ncbi:transposon Tf2-1 polyprotein [Elysia marginata]|uniref:Transposon Tf2-1 polyprotein n=1 Tax=Elysia marginata TaxID=1093978 RepID=A0AAV4FGH0_9GAST|nr:transposon Tf2-1 polyprotein [Elysia marginata]
MTGRWNDKSVSALKFVKEDLSVFDGIILRQNRIVIPTSLQMQIIKLAHASHQVIVKTKQLIGEKVWFPGIDQQVESHLKGCIPCQSSVTLKKRDPLQMSPLPKHPWDELSVDFAGPFPTGEYLLIINDDFRRFLK